MMWVPGVMTYVIYLVGDSPYSLCSGGSLFETQTCVGVQGWGGTSLMYRVRIEFDNSTGCLLHITGRWRSKSLHDLVRDPVAATICH
jgi:hypothetical protein